MLISAFGLFDIFFDLELLQWVSCNYEITKCRKYALLGFATAGSIAITGGLIAVSRNLSVEFIRFKEIVNIFGWISVGLTVISAGGPWVIEKISAAVQVNTVNQVNPVSA